MKLFRHKTKTDVQKTEEPTVAKQNPQLTSLFMKSIEQGIVPKIKRIVEQEHIISKAVIMERCIGQDVPWRKNKAVLATAKILGISIEFIEEAVKDIVNQELKKYNNIGE